MNDKSVLKINPADSVVVCLQPLRKGFIIEADGMSVTVNQDTPAGHKILIKDVKQEKTSSNTVILSVMSVKI